MILLGELHMLIPKMHRNSECLYTCICCKVLLAKDLKVADKSVNGSTECVDKFFDDKNVKAWCLPKLILVDIGDIYAGPPFFLNNVT